MGQPTCLPKALRPPRYVFRFLKAEAMPPSIPFFVKSLSKSPIGIALRCIKQENCRLPRPGPLLKNTFSSKALPHPSLWHPVKYSGLSTSSRTCCFKSTRFQKDDRFQKKRQMKNSLNLWMTGPFKAPYPKREKPIAGPPLRHVRNLPPPPLSKHQSLAQRSCATRFGQVSYNFIASSPGSKNHLVEVHLAMNTLVTDHRKPLQTVIFRKH